MLCKRPCQCLPALLGTASLNSEASPAAGGYIDYAAGVLMLLGLFAIILGVRNLRGLRHKQPPPRQQHEVRTAGLGRKRGAQRRSGA